MRSLSWSFSRRFFGFAFVVLAVGMVVIGVWVQKEISRAVIERTAGVTALYVDSLIAPGVQDFTGSGFIGPEGRRYLDDILEDTPLGAEVVSFKIWRRDGTIIYSPNGEIIGRAFPVAEDLASAFEGDVTAAISDLDEPENAFERASYDRLIETYAPIRALGTGEIVAVSEFYQLPDALLSDIAAARLRGWLVVASATIVMYLALMGMVRKASATISRQRDELVDNVRRLETALAMNARLQRRVERAAERTATINEQYLRRVSSDIHDGPAQDIAFGLLRLEHLAGGNGGPPDPVDLASMRDALESALADLRAIASGLRAPDFEGRTPADAARRAIDEFERHSGTRVHSSLADGVVAPVPVSITVYRIVKEALMNSHKYANGGRRSVLLTRAGSDLEVRVSDDGPGFDPREPVPEGSLGIAGMKERVEVLGGSFEVFSGRPTGTTIRAVIPIRASRGDSENG
jgi:signal transduction histidine kinase